MSFTNTKLDEFNKRLKDKRIAIIGLGVSNAPLIKYLADFGAKIMVFDKRTEVGADSEDWLVRSGRP